MAVWPFCLPCPRTSVTVSPEIPSCCSAALTSSTLLGRTTALINFIRDLPPAPRQLTVRTVLLPGAEDIHKASRECVLVVPAIGPFGKEVHIGPVAPVLDPHDQSLAVLDLGRQRELLQLLGAAAHETV